MSFKSKVISVFLLFSMVLCCPFYSYADEWHSEDSGKEASTFVADVFDELASTEDEETASQFNQIFPSEEVGSEAEETVVGDMSEIAYVLVERPEMGEGDEQTIIVGFVNDNQAVEHAILEVVDISDGESYFFEYKKVVPGAALFSFDGAILDEGSYRIASLEFTESDGNGSKKVSFLDDEENTYEFYIGSSVSLFSEGGANFGGSASVRAFSIDDDGSLEAKTDISDAIESVKDKEASIVSEKEPKTRSSELVVALDPGHGGRDGGAQGHELSEKNLTLKIAQYCKAELERYSGVRVVMTRSDDSYVGLSERVRYAVSQGADIFVSIHINSATASSAHGAEVIIPNDGSYYYEDVHIEGKQLAEKILAQITDLGIAERRIYWIDATDGETYPDGSLADYFTVIEESHRAGIPGIIVEHAFISNYNDASFLGNEYNLRALGVADARGIALQYGLGMGEWVLGEDGRWRWYEGSIMVTNAWRTIGGDTLWFGQDGVAVRGWFEIEAKKYYFDPNSAALCRGWLDLDGARYRLDRDDGHLWTGWYTVDGAYHYSGPDGAMLRGWLDLDGARYRLDRDDGHLWTGDFTVDGSWFHADPSGSVVSGWVAGSDGSLFFYDPAKGGALAIGWFEADGRRYYAGPGGALCRGWLDLDGARYRLDRDDGHLWTGWYTVDGAYHYSGPDGAMLRGWLDLDGARYRLDRDDGHLWTGDFTVDGSWFHADPSGSVVSGWVAGSDGSLFFYDPAKGGALAIGWFEADGRRYYAGPGGALCRGWLDLDGARYRLDRDDGHLWTGWYTVDGAYHYSGPDGAMLRGWLDLDGARYRLDRDDGHLWTGDFTVDGSWFHADPSGSVVSGWVAGIGRLALLLRPGEGRRPRHRVVRGGRPPLLRRPRRRALPRVARPRRGPLQARPGRRPPLDGLVHRRREMVLFERKGGFADGLDTRWRNLPLLRKRRDGLSI